MAAIAKFLKKNIVPIIFILIGIVASGYISNTVEAVRQFFFPNQIIAEHKYTIVTGIQGMGQLVTVKYVSETDVPVEIHSGFLNSGYYSANHIAIGVIEAGINFDMLDEGSVRLRNDSYTVSLPAPIITSCRIEYIDQNQYSTTLLSADWDMVRQIAHAEAIEQFVREMIEKGILERAAKEAALRIRDFVSNLTGSPSEIEFSEGSGELILPDSCRPFAPSGWEKVEDGGWRRAE